MAFDVQKYLKTKFERRTEDFPVPALKDWFDEGSPVVWTVQGLTGMEIGRANEAAKKQNVSTAMLEGLLSMRAPEIKDSVKALLGQTEIAPEDYARRIEHLMVGSVNPKCDLDLALQLCKAHPVTFLEITNQIVKLTGMGMEPGKQKPSGKIQKSG